MKGYKLIREDWTCDGEAYAVGKTVAMKDKPVLNERGFDFCTNMKDCLLYGHLYSDSHMCEVEAGGDVAMSAEDSHCWTNSLRVVREIPFKELMKNIIDLELLKVDQQLFLYLENPSPETCLAAVQQDGWVLKYVKDQTPEICLAAVQQDGTAVAFVKDQTPEICMAAVQQDGWALRFVKNRTPEICMAAVQQDGQALRFVKNQTPEICLAAVQQDGWALEYVENQTPEICMAAVQEYGGALRFVKNQTPEICLAAVRQDGWALQYVREQTPEVCLAAVKQNGLALRYVKEQTLEICKTAVEQNPMAYMFARPTLGAIIMADTLLDSDGNYKTEASTDLRTAGRGGVNGTNRIDTSRRSHKGEPANDTQEQMPAKNTVTPGGELR